MDGRIDAWMKESKTEKEKKMKEIRTRSRDKIIKGDGSKQAGKQARKQDRKNGRKQETGKKRSKEGSNTKGSK